MFDTTEGFISNLLGETVDELDIPPALHDAADKEYHGVGQFLADQSDTGSTEWDVYAQGSFRLGTVVRPLGTDHYDLDMVCRLDMDSRSITQAQLKDRVGEVLHAYLAHVAGEPGAPDACEDRRRCWTLTYPHAFHLDVLPALPNEMDLPDGIRLTDKQLFNWQFSNPVAYATWFRGRMETELLRKMAVLEARKDISPFPQSQIKTTLQQVVQVLKRHRDIYFADDLGDRPPSVLISTLAAHAYTGEQELLPAVIETEATMPEYVDHTDGIWRVMNPVADENFADKWNEHPERAEKFFEWRDQLASDLEEASVLRGIDSITEHLTKSLGDTVTKAAARMANTYRATRESDQLKVAASGVLGAAAGLPVKPHGFYGSSSK
jgi:hypothetical protein